MHSVVADDHQFNLAVQNVQLVRERALELRHALGTMRASAKRVQDAHYAGGLDPNGQPNGRAPAASAPRPRLTARELAILRLIADGHDNAAIAKRLHFGHGTIKLHVRGILAKFGTSNRTVAAVRAVRLGLL